MASFTHRTIFSLVNLGVLGAALGVWFLWPRYADYALYAFLGWTVIGFTLVFVPWGSASGTPAARGPAGAQVATDHPLPPGSAPAAAAQPPIGFCVFCGTDLPPEARRCLACGHAVLAL
jgi:hypothetical protein